MNNDRTLELTEALIRRPSVTPADMGCQALIAQHLEAVGFRTESMRFGEVDNLWARRGNEAPLLIFAGHSDVVPPGDVDGWRYDPFVPTLNDGLLYGRGTADMKASLAAFVTACERFVSLHPKHHGSLGVLITADEEGPAVDGTVKVVEKLMQRREHIDYCVVGEPTSRERTGDTVKNGRRGSLNGKLTVHGVQGHVAYPQLAVNPIHQIAPLLTQLTDTVWDQGDEHFPPTGFQITGLHAGAGAVNVTPAAVTAQFNFRFSMALTMEQIQRRVENVVSKRALNYDIEWTPSGHPYLTQERELINATRRAIHEQLGIETTLSTDGGTSDGRFIAPMGAQVVEFGPLNTTIHKVNECVAADDPARLSRVYLSIMEQLLC